MKNIINIVLFILSPTAFSQVIIGDDTGTSTDKTSVLLEFSKTENRGLILPYVTTLPTNPAEGTFILDATNPTVAKMKYFNGSWIDLSGESAGDISSALTIQPTNIIETSDAKVIIGANTSTTDGILVLESTEKAMVLPTVASTNDIPNPSPGMMVYLSNDKMLALYNGQKWSFWASENP